MLRSMTCVRRSAPALAAALLALWSATSVTASAQSVEGLVLVGNAKRAAQGATVFLLNQKQQPVDTAQADVFGSFALQAPSGGRYFLLVRRQGYYPILSDRFEIRDTEARVDTVFLSGPDAELTFRELFTRDLARLFGSSISAGASRYVGPEKMDSIRGMSVHLGDVVTRGHLSGLQYYPQSGCLRFSGEGGCAQVYLDGLPVTLRADQISASDIEAVMALRPLELGVFANTRSSPDNSIYGVVMLYTSRFASR
ncbi:MAG: carboxypeptidase-like regulatory domain-containing protein [Gemmatimonadaceae bacterium]